jgi:membrane-associated phospholipid phosphatase
MPTWALASIVFFTCVAGLALSLPRLNGRRRVLAVTGSGIGLVVTVVARRVPDSLLDAWIVPPSLLLVAYWTSGLLYREPMPRAERTLCAIDRLLRIRSVAGKVPRVAAELFELAYIAVYPTIPLALIIHLATSDAPDPHRFWTVILLTDYICFGLLPWVQTRPPRVLEPAPPWRARFRALNLRLLGKTSIQVNTFPSGHAAEALAAFLLVLDAPPPLAGGMLLNAMAISAAAAFGRYHYAADIIAGWVVAVVVWLAA